jgi:hypothetical protein
MAPGFSPFNNFNHCARKKKETQDRHFLQRFFGK